WVSAMRGEGAGVRSCHERSRAAHGGGTVALASAACAGHVPASSATCPWSAWSASGSESSMVTRARTRLRWARICSWNWWLTAYIAGLLLLDERDGNLFPVPDPVARVPG